MTYILQASTVGSETLVERDRETLVVLPVGNAWWDHPFFLLSGSGLAWGTPEDWGRGTRRATRNLLVLETWGLKGIFDDLRHFDDPLVQADSAILLSGGVPNERRLSLGVRNVLGLGRLDLAVDELLKCSLCFISGRLNLFLRRSLH